MMAADTLQRAGLIRYKRGNVTIIDRHGLIRRSCECYGVSKREFDRLLGGRERNFISRPCICQTRQKIEADPASHTTS